MCRDVLAQARVTVRSSASGATGDCELPDMGADLKSSGGRDSIGKDSHCDYFSITRNHRVIMIML